MFTDQGLLLPSIWKYVLLPSIELCHLHIIWSHLAPWIKVLQRNKIDSLSLKSSEIFRELAHVIWGLSDLKFKWQAGWLEIQVRVNVAVLGPNLQCRPTGGKLKQGFYLAV